VRRRVSAVRRVLDAAVELLLERRERSRPARDHRVDGRDGGHHRTAVMVTAAAAALSHVVVSTAPAASTAVAPPVPVPLRVVAVGLAAAARHRTRSFVLVRATAAHAEPAEQHEQVAAVLLCEQRVQIRIGARVERVEEHQQDLGLGHVDERVTGERGQPEERYRRPAREVGEHQQGHALGHRHVGPGHRRHCLAAAPDRRVHLCVARAYHHERDAVERQQGEQVYFVSERRVVHGQANATTQQ